MLGVCHDSPLREGLETLETQIQANPWTSLTLGVFLSGLVLGALRFVFVKPQPINECFNPKELKNGL
jgi:hypothetical protein